MVAWDKQANIFRLVAALLAIPAGAVGTYSVYRNFILGGVSCNALRSSIIATLDKNLPAEDKRALLREDVAQFDKNCGEKDPDARTIFDAALVPPPAPAQAAAASTAAPPATGAIGPVAIFGLSRSGEKRGWVVLARKHQGDADLEPNFDGFQIEGRNLPAPGTILVAKAMLPVWLDPLPPGKQDRSELQGRLASGACVKVLDSHPDPARLWVEVTPLNCK